VARERDLGRGRCMVIRPDAARRRRHDIDPGFGPAGSPCVQARCAPRDRLHKACRSSLRAQPTRRNHPGVGLDRPFGAYLTERYLSDLAKTQPVLPMRLRKSVTKGASSGSRPYGETQVVNPARTRSRMMDPTPSAP
jgi:hypothetical protein